MTGIKHNSDAKYLGFRVESSGESVGGGGGSVVSMENEFCCVLNANKACLINGCSSTSVHQGAVIHNLKIMEHLFLKHLESIKVFSCVQDKRPFQIS